MTDALEAFAAGWAIYGRGPLTERAHVAALVAIELSERFGDTDDVLERVLKTGQREGLVAQHVARAVDVRNRHGVAVRKLTKAVARVFPSEDLVDEAQRSAKPPEKDQPSPVTANRDLVKTLSIGMLGQLVKSHPDLETEWRMLVAEARAQATAEGETTAQAMAATVQDAPPVDLDELYRKTLSALRDLGDYWNVEPWIKDEIAGLAGDIGQALADGIERSAGRDELIAAVQEVIGEGDGAQFYLDEAIHTAMTKAAISVYADAGLSIDFDAVDDDRTCQACLNAEAGSPYSPGQVPSPPLHGGCRCWLTAADL